LRRSELIAGGAKVTTGKDDKGAATAQPADLAALYADAKESLAKLPILGPAAWLCARDQARRFMFMGDIDWALLPPILLDQCRLYNKESLPYAFITWAYVSDAVDARLRSNEPKIAPHEWQSGPHLWLIDVIAPFGHAEDVIDELRRTAFAGKAVRAILPGQPVQAAARFREWAPVGGS
jgi:cytolysin-activating lysine-acyltransferase